MAERNLQKHGISPAKLTLIGVLAVILVTVIVVQMSGGSSTPGLQPRRRAAAAPAAEQEAPATAPTARPAAPRTAWPRITLDDLLEHDPFAPPPWLVVARPTGSSEPGAAAPPPPSREELRRRALQRLQGMAVEMIMAGSAGIVATIDSQQVRVGDTINGFIVKDIRPDGVILVDHNSR